MAFRHTLGFPAGEVFPPRDRHVDVGGVDLDPVDPAPLLFSCYDRGARPDERVVDVTPVIVDSPLHTFDWLLGRVAGFRFPGIVDLPEGRGFTVALPVGLRALLDGVPARLVPPVVVPAADHDVPLVPDDKRPSDEAAGVEPTRGDRQGEATHPDVGDLA